ncbi:hypothetical protein ScPMuIL_002876 [Solemya velum]
MILILLQLQETYCTRPSPVQMARIIKDIKSGRLPKRILIFIRNWWWAPVAAPLVVPDDMVAKGVSPLFLACIVGLEDRIETSAARSAFITLKDHKPNFRNNPTCRLINPSKSEIGIISKQILDRINKEVTAKTSANLWKNTAAVIEWFENIQRKGEHSFITFDVCDFYPSITEKLLKEALDYASQFTTVSDQDRNIILHVKKSLLYHKNSPWIKKDTNNMFDVTMGSYDGAETCELVGAYLLSKLSPSLKQNIGLYRDDGMAVYKTTPQETERMKKQICRIFKEHDLRITIEANKKIVDFLDATFNLNDGSFAPYMKPNNRPMYVHQQSNHPPLIRKNIPENINKRLSSLSSSKSAFDMSAPQYQKALEESGYSYKLQYEPKTTERRPNNRKRGRDITWYNPPWNENAKTNVGKKFLDIVGRCSGEQHPLRKIFNRHTLKLSYSCMPNMTTNIAMHNKKIDKQKEETPTSTNNTCNYRKKDDCPLHGNCQRKNVVYQATVTDKEQTKTETYVGIASDFKERYRNHKASFNNLSRRNDTELSLEDRIETSAARSAFITLKDHKPNFRNNPTCRLINPSKSEIGIISKQILDRINKEVTAKTSANLWKNTAAVIEWFENIQRKGEHSFITFDVCDFYPSITEKLLKEALDYASQFTTVSDQDRNIILHVKKSLLYHKNSPWIKKDTNNMFDVTMGSYDGAETCELVGAYLLSKLSPSLKQNIGLYRDDGMAVYKTTPQETERMKKQICRIFKEHDLRITIEANKKIVDFLDATFNLNDGSFAPYMKPNNRPMYVHQQSNHPPLIRKNIPENINKRLSSLSSSKSAFDMSAPQYQKALEESGYSYKLQYEPKTTERRPNNRKRGRDITWYNPPWNENAKTNVGKKFLDIVGRCSGEQHPLRKIFNRHTLKLSYSCMPNMTTNIAMHNKKIDKQKEETPTSTNNTCNYRKKDDCPLHGNCQRKNVVYQATVTDKEQTKTETYVGIASDFKERYRNHKASFNNLSRRNDTELSKYIWAYKVRGKEYKIDWHILKTCAPYNNITKRCNLCQYEKFIIIRKPELSTLNKRNELVSLCRHSRKFLLTSAVRVTS